MMEKPDDIPQDVWEAASDREYAIPSGYDGPSVYDVREAIARAILAERERCARVAERLLRFADTTSEADQIISDAIRSGYNT